MTISYNADLYPREVIIKTAYTLTDKCYVHLDLVDNMYLLSIISKYNDNDDVIKNRLDNEIIAQLARYTVSEKTSEIRQLILGRAFASSMIVNDKNIPDYAPDYISSADSILKDWFEAHDE